MELTEVEKLTIEAAARRREEAQAQFDAAPAGTVFAVEAAREAVEAARELDRVRFAAHAAAAARRGRAEAAAEAAAAAAKRGGKK